MIAHKAILVRFINLGLRGSTLVAKLLLIIVLARYLEPDDVGVYGLFVATAFYVVYAVGFEFYTYATREILVQDKEKWAGVLRDEGVFFLIMYVIALPSILGIFYFELLPWPVLPLFLLIFVGEHIGTELNRFFVAISQTLFAGLLLFLRAASWITILIPVLWFFPGARSLETVLYFWLAGSFGAALLGLCYLLKLERSSLKQPINWLWISKGLKITLPFFISSLAVNGLYTIDKYIVADLAGLEVLAAYVFYIGISNSLISFLDAGVFVFYYPKMILAYAKKDSVEFKRHAIAMVVQAVAVCGLLFVLFNFSIDWVLKWLGRDVYRTYASMFPWLLLASIINVMGMLPQYCLYSCSRDREIIISHMASLPIFIIAVFIVRNFMHELTVPVALIVTFSVLFFIKLFGWLCIRKSVFSPCLN